MFIIIAIINILISFYHRFVLEALEAEPHMTKIKDTEVNNGDGELTAKTDIKRFQIRSARRGLRRRLVHPIRLAQANAAVVQSQAQQTLAAQREEADNAD